MFYSTMVVRQTRRIFIRDLLRPSLVNSIITRRLRSISTVNTFQYNNRTRRRINIPRVISSTLVPFNTHVVGFISGGMIRLIENRLHRYLQLARNLRHNRRMTPVLLFTNTNVRSRLKLQAARRFLMKFRHHFRSRLLLNSMRRTPKPMLARIRHKGVNFTYSHNQRSSHAVLPLLT